MYHSNILSRSDGERRVEHTIVVVQCLSDSVRNFVAEKCETAFRALVGELGAGRRLTVKDRTRSVWKKDNLSGTLIVGQGVDIYSHSLFVGPSWVLVVCSLVSFFQFVQIIGFSIV